MLQLQNIEGSSDDDSEYILSHVSVQFDSDEDKDLERIESQQGQLAEQKGEHKIDPKLRGRIRSDYWTS